MRIVEEYKETPNCAEIAGRYSVDCETIEQILNGSTWVWLTDIKSRKLKHPTSRKLTISQVNQIRKLHATKHRTSKQLAKHFDVTTSTICHIVTRRTWK